MRLAVYQPYLKERGGSEKVVLEVARRSRHDITVFTLLYDEENTFSDFQDIDLRVVGDEENPESFVSQAVDFGLKPLIKDLNLDDFDALLVSEAGLAFSITFRNHDIPVLAYCHTPLRAALPEFKDRYRKGFNPVLRPVFPIMLFGFNMLERLGWGNYEYIFTNSELTKERVKEKGLAGEEMLEVLNPGVETDVTAGEYGDYFLYPSRFEPYKRQELAVEAFEEADIQGFDLVLAGSSADDEYLEEIREGAGENVRVETDVPEGHWDELFSNCYSTLFLAENEDWGIIPLEAMARGKPVISVNEGGPREQVLDGETGFLVDADPGKIADRMEELAADRRKVEEMGDNGRKRAAEYTWDAFIQKLDRRTEEVMEEEV